MEWSDPIKAIAITQSWNNAKADRDDRWTLNIKTNLVVAPYTIAINGSWEQKLFKKNCR